MTPILDKILVPERERRFASKHGGFAVPVLHERAVEATDGPFVVTNARCSFVPTRRRPDGTVWVGFSSCPLDAEDQAVRTLYDRLRQLSAENGWSNRCTYVSNGMETLKNFGFDPKSMVVPHSLLKEAGVDLSVEDASKLMLAQGYVAEVDGVRVYTCAALESGTALIAAAPMFVGSYVRVDTSLAVLVQRADRSVVLVDSRGVG